LYKVYGKYSDGTEYSDEFNTVSIIIYLLGGGIWIEVMVIVFNTTFHNISVLPWRSALLVEETGIPGENRQPATNRRQTLSHNVVLSTPRLLIEDI
jgi:hypothetical protein